ncbi:MAG: hypothetical protein QW404_02765 [Candidatus Nanoarchaeia archaeon]
MRKVISLAILTIFLFSMLPLSLAKEQERNTERLQERLQEIEEERIERMEQLQQQTGWAKYNQSLGFKARVLNRIQIENARMNFIRARERFQLAKINLEQAKLRFRERQEIRKQCKAGDCNVTDEELIEHAKNFLGNSADAIIEHLNKVKEKIQENEDLTEEEAQEMINKIDAKIAEIEAAKEQAENATTKEEIREAAQKINAAWRNIKQLTTFHANVLINARIGGIIVKSEHLKEKLDRILARMEARGKDVTKIHPLIDEFNAKIDLAGEKYEAAVDKFKEFRDTEDTDTLREAQDLMKEAKKALQEANEKLREIIRAIKENNGQEEMNEEEEDEEDEEQEEEHNETETD